MRLKFLSLIVAGLAFTACSQDDDFVVDKAGQGGFSPITFTVDYGDATRAELNPIGGLKFTKDDRVSFFNGVTYKAPGAGLTGALKVGAHAPFTYTPVEDGTYQFKSPNADILAGEGVLVYPADLTQAWTKTEAEHTTGIAKSLLVSIDPVQDAEYYMQMPYASDIFTITAYKDHAPDYSAGVDRNYNIAFKPIGTMVNLTLAPDDAEGLAKIKELDPKFEITGVTLTRGGTKYASTAAFTKKVALGAEINAASNKYVASKWKGTYSYFTYGLEVYDLGNSSTYTTNTIKTAIAEDGLAHIVLLPNLSTLTASDGSVEPMPFVGGSITIHTSTLGDIKISHNSNESPISKTYESDKKFTIEEAFNAWAKYWKSTVPASLPKSGGKADHTLTFSVAALSAGLNYDVTNSEELIALMNKFKALGEDGVLKPNIKVGQEFVLTDEALAAINTYDGELEINANGKTIVLGQDKDDTKTGGNSEKLAEFAKISFAANKPNLMLAGEWALTTAADFSNIATTVYNMEKLTLTSAGVTVFADGKTLLNRGELVIPTGVVYMDEIISGSPTKDGIITIADGASCYFAEGTLHGKVTIGKNATLKSSENVTNYAAISNNGRVLGNDGTFVNEGVITNMVNGAEVAVTSNAGSSAQGFIELAGLKDRVTITNASGYVTYVLKNAAEVTADNVPSVANHLTIENASIKVVDITNMPAGIKYLALNGKINQLTNTNEAGLSFVDVFSNVAAIDYPVANKPMTISGRLWVQGTFTGYNGNVGVTDFSNGGSPVEYATGNAIKDKNKVSYGGVFFNRSVVVTP